MVNQSMVIRRPIRLDFVAIFGAFAIFILSISFSPYYNEGDQITYRKIYEDLLGVGFIDAIFLYSGTFSFTVELGHFIAIWCGSNLGASKDFLMAVFNSVLAYCAMSLLHSMKVNSLVSLTLVSSNYYMYGLYFAAERLKFGFLFFFIFLLIRRNSLIKFAALVASIFSHMQMMIIYGCILFAEKAKAVFGYLIRIKINRKAIAWLIFIIALYFLAGDYVLAKLVRYYLYGTGQDIVSFARLTALLLLSLWYSKDKRHTFMLFLPLFPAVFVVGPERVNMLGYMYFLYYGLRHKSGVNIGIFLTTTYFGLKGVSFVAEFVETGQGFGEFTTFPGNILF